MIAMKGTTRFQMREIGDRRRLPADDPCQRARLAMGKRKELVEKAEFAP